MFVYLSKQRFDEIIGGNNVQVTHKIHCGDNTATLHDHDTVMVTQDFWIMENWQKNYFLEYVCYSLQLNEEDRKSVHICTDGDPSIIGSYSGFTDQQQNKLLFNNYYQHC